MLPLLKQQQSEDFQYCYYPLGRRNLASTVDLLFTPVLLLALADFFFSPRANIRGMKHEKRGNMRGMWLSTSDYVNLPLILKNIPHMQVLRTLNVHLDQMCVNWMRCSYTCKKESSGYYNELKSFMTVLNFDIGLKL